MLRPTMRSLGDRPTARAAPFARDGVAVLERFVTADELRALGGGVEGHARALHDPACARPHNTLLPLRWNDAMVRTMLDDEARVGRLIEAVGADDLRWISGYVSVKEARSLALWWHQDWWCWDHAVSYHCAATQVAVLCYLSDTNTANGALRVLPGSHHRSAAIHALLPEAHSHAAHGLDPGHPAMSDLPSQRTIAVRAGDAVVMDYRLLHGTHANETAARRDAILLTFTPSWSRLPADLRAHLIDHPALPTADEEPAEAWQARLLPDFDGPRASLALNRNAPAEFRLRYP